ncbi:MAG: hypothetical protein ABI763_03760 [Bacteroidota bacterium]
MKKIAGILISALFWTNLIAQNPVQRADTTSHSIQTDSVDFKSQPNGNSPSPNKDMHMRIRKDSLPTDDRKPSQPPKEK